MPLPKSVIRLTTAERTELEDLMGTGKRTASVILHARILLKADAGANGPGWDDDRIAEARMVKAFRAVVRENQS